MDDYVTDLVEVVRSLPQPPVIVAHSLGGFIAQKYLENYDAPAVAASRPRRARAAGSSPAASCGRYRARSPAPVSRFHPTP
ncbi:MAG: alpha/beta fold hydrolase [Anaerolineae bacterium]